jgi:hypothetical protein
MTSTMLTVPAAMADYLRSGLHSEIGIAAEAIAQVVIEVGREEDPGRYREPLERFDQARALLDQIGWSAAGRAIDVCVDLCEHRQAVLGALRLAMVAGDADLEEATRVDAERAGRGEAPKREATIRQVRALRRFVSAIESEHGSEGKRSR